MVVYHLALDLEGNGIRFAQNTTQTLIGGQLKTTPVFINVSAGQTLLSELKDGAFDIGLV